MGTGKKERNRLVRQGKTGTGMDNVKVKGENFYRVSHTRDIKGALIPRRC